METHENSEPEWAHPPASMAEAVSRAAAGSAWHLQGMASRLLYYQAGQGGLSDILDEDEYGGGYQRAVALGAAARAIADTLVDLVDEEREADAWRELSSALEALSVMLSAVFGDVIVIRGVKRDPPEGAGDP